MPPTSLQIVSWNVNGIRACTKKGFPNWLDQCNAQIVGLQEVRALPEQIPAEVRTPEGWHVQLSPAERKGYSGVALYSRMEPDQVETQLGEERFDREGRVLLARFGRLVLANIYFPNGNGKDRDNSRVPYKLDFYRCLHDKLSRYRKSGYRVLVMGDFNTAHQEIDLARPKQNRETSGFLPEECAELDRWVDSGWTDTFRHFESGPEHYTWWSQRGGARARNVGWRIDYVMASQAAMPFVKKTWHTPDVMGSDHCPIHTKVNAKITLR